MVQRQANQAKPLGHDHGGSPRLLFRYHLRKEANHDEQIGNREGFRQVADCAASQARFACRVVSSSGYDDDRQAGKNIPTE